MFMNFLGTRAPFYMDIFVVMVALLPLLVGLSIWQAINKRYRLHIFMQMTLFMIALVVAGYVEYSLYFQGAFEHYIVQSSFNQEIAFYLLILQMVVTLITMILWFSAIKYAREDRKRRALPGLYTKSHKRLGKIVAFAIFLMSLVSISLYWILFVA